jgi:DMSO/TMAO reductase YedYZ molybdopterin-dependent catalytic subunit
MGEKNAEFLVGATAGAFALFLSFLLRVAAGGIFVPELAAQTLFSLTPGEIESRAVETLGPFAKYLALMGATIVNVCAYGLLAVLTGSILLKPSKKVYARMGLPFSLAAYIVVLAIAIITLQITEVATRSASIPLAALYLLAPHLLLGQVAVYLREAWQTPSSEPREPAILRSGFDRRRRLVIQTGAAAAVASVILYFGLDILFKSSGPSSQPRPPPGVTGIFADPKVSAIVSQEATPNDQFYRVDVNIITPAVDPKTWNLAVKGLVNNPLTLSYDQLKALPSVEQYATLECVSNTIGGDLISTALWKGVPLKDLLEKAQTKGEATYVVFRCQDGYDVGIPLERGMLDGTLLAYEMNREALSQGHGFPLRVIVPGLYGMMNAKWVTEIELVNKEYPGFWQRRGWANNAHYETHSMIAVPGAASVARRFSGLESPRLRVGEMTPIAGVAFAGDRGVVKVEVSTDGGDSWTEATIKDPLSNYTWVLWATEWIPPAQGAYRLIVRATDKTGKVQTAELHDPFPRGATGYHVVDVTVQG